MRREVGEQEVQKRWFGTHSGTFHADEVTACALLSYVDLIDLDKVLRTRDPQQLARCEYVCDVGGTLDPLQGRFDHHQADYQGNKSSAGLVLVYLQERALLDPGFASFLEREWICGVDAHDNGEELSERGVLTFSHIIAQSVPLRTSEGSPAPELLDRAFMEAVQFTLQLLERMARIYAQHVASRAQVEEVMHTALEKDPLLLVFSRPIHWMESFFELGGEAHPALFVLMPADDQWKLRAIPPKMSERMSLRARLPLAWAGLHDEELERVCGIPGAVFCHKGGFISVWKSKEAALEAYRYVIVEGGYGRNDLKEKRAKGREFEAES